MEKSIFGPACPAIQTAATALTMPHSPVLLLEGVDSHMTLSRVLLIFIMCTSGFRLSLEWALRHGNALVWNQFTDKNNTILKVDLANLQVLKTFFSISLLFWVTGSHMNTALSANSFGYFTWQICVFSFLLVWSGHDLSGKRWSHILPSTSPIHASCRVCFYFDSCSINQECYAEIIKICNQAFGG